MSQIEKEIDLELPGADSHRFNERDVHRLTIRGDHPNGWAHTVELDGHQCMCSEVQISMSAGGLVKAVITLPAVILDMDSNVVTSVLAPFVLKEARKPA